MGRCTCDLSQKIDMDNLPECPLAYDIISMGLNKGIFQLESHLGRRYGMAIQPRNIEEISALVSLIRPGALDSGMMDEYIKVRNGQKTPEYLHEKLRPIFQNSNGVLIYQEQIMQICQQLAGFTLSEADSIRKAVGKKLPEEMAKWHIQFIDGCRVHSNITSEDAEHIWKWFENSADYLFNKSHGVSYSIITYQTAYAKSHYPVEFYLAMLKYSSNKQDSIEEITELINDAKLFDIKITPPDLRKLNIDFEIVADKQIAFGISHIKNIGQGSIGSILNLQKYDLSTWKNCLLAFLTCKVKSTAVRALIKSGALDYLNISRSLMLKDYDLISKETTQKDKDKKYTITGKSLKMLMDTLGSDEFEFLYQACFDCWNNDDFLKRSRQTTKDFIVSLCRECESFSSDDDEYVNSLYEKFFLGVQFSQRIQKHPKATHACKDIYNLSPGTFMRLCVMISHIRTARIKNGPNKGKPMAFLSAGDNSYTHDQVMMFSHAYEKNFHKLIADNVYLLDCQLMDGLGVSVNKIERL
jgi:DNA polymerase III alpha subunit